MKVAVAFAFILAYISLTLGNCPRGVYEYEVTDEDKATILAKHNDLRRQIANGEVRGQPRGVNLKRMKWNNYLAGWARTIAASCEYRHQPVDDARFNVGQNLYINKYNSYKKGPRWDEVVQYWFNEQVNYTYSPHYVFAKNTGHYTQVVWADTDLVGCGWTHFQNETGGIYFKYYVCNYGPGGNIDGAEIYKRGSSGCENLC